MFASTNTGVAPSATPAGWAELGQRSLTDLRTTTYTKLASASDAGQSVTVTLPSWAKTDLTLLAYSGVDPTSPVLAWDAAVETTTRAQHTTPPVQLTTASSWVVSYWVDKSSASTGWALPAGQTQRSSNVGSSSGRLTSVSSDPAGATGPGPWPGVTATSTASSTKATMWTIALLAL